MLTQGNHKPVSGIVLHKSYVSNDGLTIRKQKLSTIWLIGGADKCLIYPRSE